MKDWFINQKRLANYNPSVAENRISKILAELGYYYEQEISFNECRNSFGNLLVFDFIIPKKMALIEYDGRHHQTSQSTIEHDIVKNKFAKDFGYKLIRLNKNNWNTLKEDLAERLSKIKQKKKSFVFPKDRQKSLKLSKEGNGRKPHTKKEIQKAAFKKVRVTIDDYNAMYGSK